MNFITSQNLSVIFDGIIAIGAVGILLGSFFNGRKGQKKDDIETENSAMELQSNKIKVLEKALEDQQKINTDIGKKIAALEAVNIEKDKTIKEYLAILQNRNPELDKVLSEILDFMKKINIHMEKDMQIVGTVSTK